MEIASDMCVYTNKNFVVEVVDCSGGDDDADGDEQKEKKED